MPENLQFVSFYLDRFLYGFDIRIIKEVNPTLEISPVPRTPPHIRGLVNIRGQVVLVMDIAVTFGRSPRPITSESKIIILKTDAELRKVRDYESVRTYSLAGDKPVGLLVDKIGDVISIPRLDLEAAPHHLEELRARYFFGVARIEGELLMILDAGKLLSDSPATAFVSSVGLRSE